MKEEMEKQFLAESKDLKRSIRNNMNARRFSIFVLVVVWVAVIFHAIEAFMLPGDTLTLKHIFVQNNLHFQLIMAFIYTAWCGYNIPKGDELCKSAMNAFTERWEKFVEDNKEECEKENKEEEK